LKAAFSVDVAHNLAYLRGQIALVGRDMESATVRALNRTATSAGGTRHTAARSRSARSRRASA
jgi:hypothetical protein